LAAAAALPAARSPSRWAGGFVGVLMMIALAGIIGAALSRGISETA
jgi:predicted lipid-binding transport protein (Tim44 family)